MRAAYQAPWLSVSTLLVFSLVLLGPTFSEGYIEGFFNLFKHASSSFVDSDQQPDSTFVSSSPSPHRRNLSSGALELGDNQGQDEEVSYRVFQHRDRKFTTVKNSQLLHSAKYNFEPQRQTKIIVHGFLDNGDSEWQELLANAFADVGDFNVFVVDWSHKATIPYFAAVQNTKLVGKDISDFIRNLQQQYNVSLEQVHCIGHSLGAQICGHVGKELSGKLGRITGLDPAAPGFEPVEFVDRLNPSNAKFVDAIHTDKKRLLIGFGMKHPCGHMDFYPNGGRYQPGCTQRHFFKDLENWKSKDFGRKAVFSCDHHRAIDFFLESIRAHKNETMCRHVGHLCANYNDYLQGKCGSCGEDGTHCAIMGLDADKYPLRGRENLKFYLSTGAAIPFCLRHYRINVHLDWNKIKGDGADGYLKFIIRQEANKETTFKVDVKLIAGKNITLVIPSTEDLRSIEKVMLRWVPRHHFFSESSESCARRGDCSLFVKQIEISDMDAFDGVVSATNALTSRTLCGANDAGVNSTKVDPDKSATKSFNRQCQ